MMAIGIPLGEAGAYVMLAGSVLDWGMTVVVPVAPGDQRARVWRLVRVDERLREVHIWLDAPQGGEPFRRGAAMAGAMADAMVSAGYEGVRHAGR